MGTPIKGRRGRPSAASAPEMDLNPIATPLVTPSQPGKAGLSRTKTPKSSQTQKNKTPRKRGIDDSTIAPPLIGVPVIDLTGDAASQPKKAKKAKNATGDDGSGTKKQSESTWREPERRLRKWRDHPPQSYLERLDRIRTTRYGFYYSCLFLCTD